MEKKGFACVLTDPIHLNPNSTWRGVP